MGVASTPFFLETPAGQRFCMLHCPNLDGAIRGVLLYLHPFAEEMNKSRRMIAHAARNFAACGMAVLCVDLKGCGDSAGDFADASWDDWLQDAQAAIAWLRERYSTPIGAWGLRVGALLAAELAELERLPFLLLWQPVVSGEQFLTQFLRLKLAGEMLAEGGAGNSTAQMWAQLEAGESLEIAGYSLSPGLALPLRQRKLSQYAYDGVALDWIELLPAADRNISPAVQKQAQSWQTAGARVNLSSVVGSAYWSTQEITDVPELLAVPLAWPGVNDAAA